MQLMPKLWIAVAVNLVVFGIAVVTTHKYTKAAYHAVGFNDGTIDSNARILQRFTEIAGTIPRCTSEQQHKSKEIVSVKAEAIYVIVKGPDIMSLCRAQ